MRNSAAERQTANSLTPIKLNIMTMIYESNGFLIYVDEIVFQTFKKLILVLSKYPVCDS